MNNNTAEAKEDRDWTRKRGEGGGLRLQNRRAVENPKEGARLPKPDTNVEPDTR